MILAFGKTGQVARELQRLGGVIALGRDEADLTQPESCAKAILDHRPTAVINAAAYTAVDRAESEEQIATLINCEAPAAMARACAELGIPFVHISTDYVFDGTGDKPWRPSDAPNPINAYGRSKLAAEVAIKNSGATYAILRSSWVVSAHGTNFIKTMLRLCETRDELSIINDQIGGPTPATDIAKACRMIAAALHEDASKSGIYHFSGSPDVSWHGFASEIFAQSNRNIHLRAIATNEYPTKAARPHNSRLNCAATEAQFGIKRPDWRSGLSAILEELGAAT